MREINSEIYQNQWQESFINLTVATTPFENPYILAIMRQLLHWLVAERQNRGRDKVGFILKRYSLIKKKNWNSQKLQVQSLRRLDTKALD